MSLYYPTAEQKLSYIRCALYLVSIFDLLYYAQSLELKALAQRVSSLAVSARLSRSLQFRRYN